MSSESTFTDVASKASMPKQPKDNALASRPSANEALLSVHKLSVDYGGIHAVKSLNLHVNRGELVCLIGANGAGKSSTLNALGGLVSYESAQARFKGLDLHSLPAQARLPNGLALVPEGRGIFKRLTIEENLLTGAMHLKNKQTIDAGLEEAYAMFPRLKERRLQSAGTLSGGEQQMLAIARALMGKPEMLLMDEPSMGLAPLMVEKIFEVVQSISKAGITVLLVEQNAQMALEIASRAYVLDSGEVILEGEASSLLHDPRVREAYLGE